MKLTYHWTKAYDSNVLLAKEGDLLCFAGFFYTKQIGLEQLSTCFPKSTLKQEGDFEKEIEAIKSQDFSAIQLKLDGTAFQKEVWNSLLTLPYGKTLTYSSLANKLGKPKAARAVANAVGKNKIALAVPCHRIVRKDGSLGGYRWGLDLKKDLLESEGSF